MIADAIRLQDDEEIFDPYPTIRTALAPEYADLDPEGIEDLVESLYEDFTAEELEELFKGIGKALKNAGKVARRALPGVVKGATAGFAAGGPIGALVGAAGGGAISALSSAGRKRRGRRRGRPRARRGRPRARGRRRTRGRRRGGSPAATQLLRLLGNPRVSQALMSAVLGRAGRRNVRVGSVSVPTGAITNLLGRLLDRAQVELHENMAGEGGIPEYLLDEDGEFIVDPADAEERADLLLELLADEEDDEWPDQMEIVVDEDVFDEDDDDDSEYDDDEAGLEFDEAYQGVSEED